MNGILSSPMFWPIFWVVLAVALGALEAGTVQLVAVWFALGAVVAVVPALMGAPVWVQFFMFVVVSGLAMALTRPFLMKVLRVRKQSTNADRVLGETGVVVEAIDNDAARGRVQAMGLSWSARSADGEDIPVGEKVTVLAIDGVKLIVQRKTSPRPSEEATKTEVL